MGGKTRIALGRMEDQLRHFLIEATKTQFALLRFDVLCRTTNALRVMPKFSDPDERYLHRQRKRGRRKERPRWPATCWICSVFSEIRLGVGPSINSVSRESLASMLDRVVSGVISENSIDIVFISSFHDAPL